MELYILSFIWMSLIALSWGQNMRTPPGVPPQQYQHQMPQQHVPMQMQQQVPVQHHQVPMQQHQQHQQQHQQHQQHHQVPVQHHQVPVQHQVPMQPPVPHSHHGAHPSQQLLNAAHIAQEKDHIKEHMEVPIDTSNMSEQELQFHYFKMHDADNNNKLDGCELIKSLIHWHDPGDSNKDDGKVNREQKIIPDDILAVMVDPVFINSDLNNDGFLDYAEFVLQSAN